MDWTSSQISRCMYVWVSSEFWDGSLNHSPATYTAICEPILKAAHHMAIFKRNLAEVCQ